MNETQKVIAKAPTMAEVNAQRRAVPKGQIQTHLATKIAKDKEEKAAERKWRAACIKRDGKICRCCGRVVVAQLELAPNRLEVHHLTRRAEQATRWDVRNGIVLCQLDHSRVTRYEVVLVQAARYLLTIAGKKYIDGAKPITFQVQP